MEATNGWKVGSTPLYGPLGSQKASKNPKVSPHLKRRFQSLASEKVAFSEVDCLGQPEAEGKQEGRMEWARDLSAPSKAVPSELTASESRVVWSEPLVASVYQERRPENQGMMGRIEQHLGKALREEEMKGEASLSGTKEGPAPAVPYTEFLEEGSRENAPLPQQILLSRSFKNLCHEVGLEPTPALLAELSESVKGGDTELARDLLKLLEAPPRDDPPGASPSPEGAKISARTASCAHYLGKLYGMMKAIAERESKEREGAKISSYPAPKSKEISNESPRSSSVVKGLRSRNLQEAPPSSHQDSRMGSPSLGSKIEVQPTAGSVPVEGNSEAWWLKIEKLQKRRVGTARRGREWKERVKTGGKSVARKGAAVVGLGVLGVEAARNGAYEAGYLSSLVGRIEVAHAGVASKEVGHSGTFEGFFHHYFPKTTEIWDEERFDWKQGNSFQEQMHHYQDKAAEGSNFLERWFYRQEAHYYHGRGDGYHSVTGTAVDVGRGGKALGEDVSNNLWGWLTGHSAHGAAQASQLCSHMDHSGLMSSVWHVLTSFLHTVGC